MAKRIIGYVKGPKGDAATVSVGSTTTLPAGSQATVTNSGTSSAATLDFGIPKGDKGDPGTPGVSDYATDQAAGLVRLGDDFSINSSNGVLSLKNAFTKAASLAALVSQEAFATSMGKIAKAVDTVITIAGDYLKSTDIVDSLTSSLANKALSAKQGKALKDGLDSLNDSLAILNGSITPNMGVLIDSFDLTYSHVMKTGNVAILSLLTNTAHIKTTWENICTVSFKPKKNTMFLFFTNTNIIDTGEGYVSTDGNVYVRVLSEGDYSVRMSCAYVVK